VGSLVYSSLEHRFHSLLPVVQSLIPRHELDLVYQGYNKVQNIEDCLLFFPNIFKLQRAVFYTQIRRDAGLALTERNEFAIDEDDLFTDAAWREEREFDLMRAEGNMTEKDKRKDFSIGVLNDMFRYAGYHVMKVKKTVDSNSDFS
jgi:hypothetical protein